MEYPKELHRFFSYQRGLETLQNKQLYFADFLSYNDPQEILPGSKELIPLLTTIDSYRTSVTELVETEQGKEMFDDLGLAPTLGIMAVKMSSTFSCFFAGLYGVYSYYKNKNKKRELQKIKFFVQNYLSLLMKTRTCCFVNESDETQPKFDNMLMWTYHADGHNGLSIKFDTFAKYWSNFEFKKVTYSDMRIPLPKDDTTPNEFVWKILTNKSKCWKFENEFRLVALDMDNNNPFFHISPESVLEIRLGLNMSKENERKIIQVRDNFYPHAVIKKAQISRFNFRLDYITL